MNAADRRPHDLQHAVEGAVLPPDVEPFEEECEGDLAERAADGVGVDDPELLAPLDKPEDLATGRRRG